MLIALCIILCCCLIYLGFCIFVLYRRHRILQEEVNVLSKRNDNAIRKKYKIKALECLQKNIPFFVVIIDFDGFKEISNMVGHRDRQCIIDEMFRRIEAINHPCLFDGLLREKEYVSIITDISIEDMYALTEKMLLAFDEVFHTKNYSVSITASIGWCSSLDGGETPSAFLKKANIALSEAKKLGGNTVIKFEHKMLDNFNRKLAIMKDIKRGLQADEFEPWFQPRISLTSNAAKTIVKVPSVEALARWEKQDGEIIYPGEFIKVAEDCGLILELGFMIMLKTCIQIRKWEKKFGDKAPKVSVNVSPKQFVSNLPETIKTILKITKINPKNLEIEITESSMFSDSQKVKEALYEISAMGIDIAVDDFGSGYSSFAYLKNLPVNIIKIDASITQGLANGNNNQIIMRSIIDIATKLQFGIVIEGVETNAALQSLFDLKVFTDVPTAEVQGYLFAKPTRAKHFEPWFEGTLEEYTKNKT